MQTLIQPTTATEPDPKTSSHYKRGKGDWVLTSIIDGGGVVSVGANHELVTGQSPEEVAKEREWSQPHLESG